MAQTQQLPIRGPFSSTTFDKNTEEDINALQDQIGRNGIDVDIKGFGDYDEKTGGQSLITNLDADNNLTSAYEELRNKILSQANSYIITPNGPGKVATAEGGSGIKTIFYLNSHIVTKTNFYEDLRVFISQTANELNPVNEPRYDSENLLSYPIDVFTGNFSLASLLLLNVTNGKFNLFGDQTPVFTQKKQFEVFNSTNPTDDGIFTVVSAVFDRFTNITTVTVIETANSTTNGTLDSPTIPSVTIGGDPPLNDKVPFNSLFEEFAIGGIITLLDGSGGKVLQNGVELMPAGSIIMISGNDDFTPPFGGVIKGIRSCPPGYKTCDNSNISDVNSIFYKKRTPDLRSLFIMGEGGSPGSVGDVGGSDFHRHLLSHNGGSGAGDSHTHTFAHGHNHTHILNHKHTYTDHYHKTPSSTSSNLHRIPLHSHKVINGNTTRSSPATVIDGPPKLAEQRTKKYFNNRHVHRIDGWLDFNENNLINTTFFGGSITSGNAVAAPFTSDNNITLLTPDILSPVIGDPIDETVTGNKVVSFNDENFTFNILQYPDERESVQHTNYNLNVFKSRAVIFCMKL